MNRLYASIAKEGVRPTSQKLRALMADYWFDFKYGVECCSWGELRDLKVQSANKESGYCYKPSRVLTLRHLFRRIQPLIDPGSVLVDIGSGKGRVLMVASEFGFREARGVEFAAELCETARKNISRFKEKTQTATAFKIVEGDATQYAFQSDENTFILYNPFDGAMLSKVLDNIGQSLKIHPRKVLVVYYNPRWRQVIEQRKEYQAIDEFEFAGLKLTVYSNQPAALRRKDQ